MVYFACMVKVAFESEPHHAAEFTREGISYNRYHPHRPKRDQRECYTIVTRNHHEVIGLVLDNLVHLRNIARSLLHAYDVFKFTCKPQASFGCHVHTGAPGHVIQYHRQRACRGNGLVMLVYSFLRRFVVIRHNRQNGTEIRQIECLRCLDDCHGIVAAKPKDKRHTTVHTFGNKATHLSLFVGRQGCGLGCSSKYDKEIDAAMYLILKQAGKRIKVD